MCGRVALAHNADDVDNLLVNQYFPVVRADNDDEDGGGSGGDGEQEEESARRSAEDEEAEAALRSLEEGDDLEIAGRSSPASKGKATEVASTKKLNWTREATEGHRSRYNVGPQSRSIIIRQVHKGVGYANEGAKPGEYLVDYMKWGLIPSYTKFPPPKPLNTINARDDSVASGKGMWNSMRSKKRCIIITDGFYEWLKKGKDKLPYFTKHKDGRLMVLAGLWDETTYADSEPLLKTYTIITTDSNPQLKFLHDRMPAILNSEKDIKLWLSDAPWGKDIEKLVKPFEGKLECYRVNQDVGNVRKDEPDFILPIATRPGGIGSFFSKSPTKPAVSSTSTSSSLPSTSGSASASKNEGKKVVEKKVIKKDRESDDKKVVKRARSRSSSIEIIEDRAVSAKKKKK